MNSLHIPVVIGTARKNRESEKVAQYVSSFLQKKQNITTEIVDVRDHVQEAITVPPWGEGGVNENGSAWEEIVKNSNALILVIPEYNHGYPGELKLLLDSLYESYKNMPVYTVGVSAGTLGGARVIDHIRPVLIEMYLVPIRESLNFSKVKEAFAEDGSIKDRKTTEYLERGVTELVEIAKKLRPLK